jgi:hypothetical protein
MKKIILAFVAITMLGSCSAYRTSMNANMPQLEISLGDVEISEEYSATASVKVYIGLIRTGANKLSSSPAQGMTVRGASQRAATYKLLKEHPDYDFVMYPKFNTKYQGGILAALGLYNVETTTVTAKLGKLK